MLTREEAVRFAKSRNTDYNRCEERENAFVFYVKDALSFGGVASPVAVLKEDGAVMPFSVYIDSFGTETVCSFEL